MLSEKLVHILYYVVLFLRPSDIKTDKNYILNNCAMVKKSMCVCVCICVHVGISLLGMSVGLGKKS